jgi:hypothetical protein
VSPTNGKQENAVENADLLFHACTVVGDYRNACIYSQLCQTVKDAIRHSEKQAQIIANQVNIVFSTFNSQFFRHW